MRMKMGNICDLVLDLVGFTGDEPWTDNIIATCVSIGNEYSARKLVKERFAQIINRSFNRWETRATSAHNHFIGGLRNFAKFLIKTIDERSARLKLEDEAKDIAKLEKLKDKVACAKKYRARKAKEAREASKQ